MMAAKKQALRIHFTEKEFRREKRDGQNYFRAEGALLHLAGTRRAAPSSAAFGGVTNSNLVRVASGHSFRPL
jgi:hypothetical protein